MTNIEMLMMDDGPDPHGIHLYPEQRLSMFEHFWSVLSPSQKQVMKGWEERARFGAEKAPSLAD